MNNAEETIRALKCYALTGRCNGDCDKCENHLDEYHSAKDVMSAAADRIESLQFALANSQRRERAAIEDLEARSDCGFCAKAPMNGGSCHPDDLDCPGWQWRGPQEAGKGESDEK